MQRSISWSRWAPAAALVGAVLAAISCGGSSARDARSAAPENASLPDRIARGLAAASPMADPSDPRARDAAAEKLVRLDALLEAAGENIQWTGFDSKKGFDLEQYKFTEFSPSVWAKLYASTFMFPGAYRVSRQQGYTVLEMTAKFRDGLDSGDYPYPFWHSQRKWQGYAGADAILLVFKDDKIAAAFRRAPDGAMANAPERPWDGRWRWTENDTEQPRVTLFSYLFSEDNPARENLDRAYRKLEQACRAQNCVGCHAPDNIAKASPLILLCFPNQALAARHSLTEVLRQNRMPPKNTDTGAEAGIHDEAARQELLDLAAEFARQADAALAHEAARSASKDPSGN